ncbi:MAG: helix-turn-helix transcriptional regulator [Candidatus Micrarchaeota archaeon]|nr:helix-turn-helix transcriptional regulator [Candidatus Micrarchaeota archaeon]
MAYAHKGKRATTEDKLLRTELGSSLESARVIASITRESLANSAGINQETVRRVEVGEAMPKDKTFFAMLNVLKEKIPKEKYNRLIEMFSTKGVSAGTRAEVDFPTVMQSKPMCDLLNLLESHFEPDEIDRIAHAWTRDMARHGLLRKDE